MSTYDNCARALNTSGLAPAPLKPARQFLEDREQRALAAELRYRVGEPGRIGKGGVLWFALDHSNSSAREGARKKAKGVIAGIPDLVFRRGGKGYARTYWIELKRKRGAAASVAQVALMDHLAALGDASAVCHGAEAAIEQLRQWKLIA